VLRPGAAALDLTAIVEHFTEHGYARLGSVVTAPFLDALRARADEIMLGRVVYPGMFFQHDSETGRREDLKLKLGYVGPSLEYRKIEKLERDDLYHALLSNPLFERVTRALIGADVAIYRAVLFTKGRSGGSPIPWHQDGGDFWGLDRDPSLQVWTAIDDATRESGCVEVIPGSHRSGLATPLGGMIPDPVLATRGNVSKAVALEARAGEVILIHNYLWHRSGRNASGAPRRAFTVCYMDAATRCRRKKHAPRQFVRVFSGQLPSGARSHSAP
jgi:phytanoyl-CoA hydroxylase